MVATAAAQGHHNNSNMIKQQHQRNSCDHVSKNKTVLRVAMSFIMAMALILYVFMFISHPNLFRNMLLAVTTVPCGSSANNVDASDVDQQQKQHTSSTAAGASSMQLSTSFSPSSLIKARSGNNHPNSLESQKYYVLSSENNVIMENFRYPDAADPSSSSGRQSPDLTEMTTARAIQGLREERSSIGESPRPDLDPATGIKNFSILIGVMTMASKTERRNLLRLAYGGQSSPAAHIQVRFVLGAFHDEGGGRTAEIRTQKTLLAMENATYSDIIMLDCPENLNEGKTLAFFLTLPGRGLEYDYVMKTDDDSYVRFENLGKSLQPLPRTDLYYGYILPCENTDPYAWYMAGMGYLISWDLVLWIRDSPIARSRSVGTEDQLVGDWLNEGGVAKHRVNAKPKIYDHPEFGGNCAHELVPDTILVHQVKTRERWADVLAFFEKDRISSGQFF